MKNPIKFEHVGKPEFPVESSVRFCVWRARPTEGGRVFLHFVDSENLALDDLIFCDSPTFSGYAKIVDFVRHSDGTISDYTLQDASVAFNTSFAMAKTTSTAAEAFLKKSEDNVCVVVCLKSKTMKDRKSS